MGSVCCLPRRTRRIAKGKNSKTPDASEKEDGTKEENSTLETERRGFSPQQEPRDRLGLCTYANSPKLHVRKMKHTATGTEKSVTVELLQISSRNSTRDSATVLREEIHSDVETGRGASYRDDGTTLIHGKDLEDDSTKPAEREDSTSSLPHLSLTKLSNGVQGTVVQSSSIESDPERTLNRELQSVSNKDDSTTLNHSKEPENQNTEPVPDLREDSSCSSVPHLPSSDFSDGAQGAAVQGTSQYGELEDNQKEVQPTSTDEMRNCVEPPLQGTSGDGTVVEHVPLSVKMTNEGIEDFCQQPKDSSNSIDEVLEDSLEFQDCEQEFHGPLLEGKMDSQGKDEDSKDTSEDKDNQLDSQNTEDSVPDTPDLPPEETLDEGNSYVHVKSSSGDANVDQQIIVQETVVKDNEYNDPESSNHPSISAASESTLHPPTCQYAGCTRRCIQSKNGTYYDYCCSDHKKRHQVLRRKSTNVKGRKTSDKSEESDHELHPTSEGSVAGQDDRGKEHQPMSSNLLDMSHHQQTNVQMSLQENPDRKQREVQKSLQENLDGKQKDVQALLTDNKQLYRQSATQESLNNAHQCPDVQTHQTTGDRKEYNHQKLPETSNSVDKGAEATTTFCKTKTKGGPHGEQPRKTKSKRSQRPVHFYHKHEPYYEFTNFYLAHIWVDDKSWATTENYFQAQKYIGTPLYGAIQECGTAREAFTISRSPQGSRWRRSDWEEVKQDVMYLALYAKFTQHHDLKKRLLGTGDRLLVEHTERDRYWGDGGDGRGENHLGKLLMKLRGELNV